MWLNSISLLWWYLVKTTRSNSNCRHAAFTMHLINSILTFLVSEFTIQPWSVLISHHRQIAQGPYTSSSCGLRSGFLLSVDIHNFKMRRRACRDMKEIQMSSKQFRKPFLSAFVVNHILERFVLYVIGFRLLFPCISNEVVLLIESHFLIYVIVIDWVLRAVDQDYDMHV